MTVGFVPKQSPLKQRHVAPRAPSPRAPSSKLGSKGRPRGWGPTGTGGAEARGPHPPPSFCLVDSISSSCKSQFLPQNEVSSKQKKKKKNVAGGDPAALALRDPRPGITGTRGRVLDGTEAVSQLPHANEEDAAAGNATRALQTGAGATEPRGVEFLS